MLSFSLSDDKQNDRDLKFLKFFLNMQTPWFGIKSLVAHNSLTALNALIISNILQI